MAHTTHNIDNAVPGEAIPITSPSLALFYLISLAG